MSAEFGVDQLVALYADLGRRIAGHATGDDALSAVTEAAVATVPGVQFASITRKRADHLQTLAPTDPVASAIDRLQYELDSGPCVDAVAGRGPLVTGALADDRRWPRFGPTAAASFGIHSMLSTTMVVDDDIHAALNLFSRRADAFDRAAQTMAMVLTAHGALAVGRAFEHEQVTNLTVALTSSRRIGMAIGVLMASRRLTADQAFALIRLTSQNTNRRVAVIVEDVIETGTLRTPFDAKG